MGEYGTQVQVGRDVLGQFVIGDHNLTVRADNSSVVTVLLPGQQPQPQPRTAIGLLPSRARLRSWSVAEWSA